MRKPFIVAEMSCNHLGSLSRALEIVEAAAKAGADAVKVQTWTPDTMCVDPAYTVVGGPWAERTLIGLYREAHTPWDWHGDIFSAARKHGIEAFASVFDSAALAFLQSIGCPRYKIASFELVDTPLIAEVSRTGKPVILSTGMATWADIVHGTNAAFDAGCNDLTVLVCSSAYPADPKQTRLANMIDLAETFGASGLSDHTLGIGCAIAASAAGADVIEKHLTLRRADGGPDAGFSAEPQEFAQMVAECMAVAGTLSEMPGSAWEEVPGESTALRRSVYVVRDIPAGKPIEAADLRTARPALGIAPRRMHAAIGCRATRNLRAGEPLTEDAVEWS